MRDSSVLLASLLVLSMGTALTPTAPTPAHAAEPSLPTTESSRLVPRFHADHIWNAVTTTRTGRVFVGFPGADRPGISVEEVARDGARHPFPDDRWNSWKTGDKPDGKFVRVNALRIGPDGKLWIVDAGAPGIGKPDVPGAPRIIRVDLETNKVDRVYPLGDAARTMSYIDDIRFNGRHAYITDAGDPALIVLDLNSGATRRVLEHQPSTTDTRPMWADGKLLRDDKGADLHVQADQLEVSPDAKWLYFQTAAGPFFKIPTTLLDDPSHPPAELDKAVTPFANTGTTGGTAIDAAGNVYASDTDHRSILKIMPDGHKSVLIADPRLIWSDAMWIDDAGTLWIPATQQNRTPGFDGGTMSVQYPVWIYTMAIGAKPSPLDHP